ncbi:alpha/beta-hydrolase [Marasmius fiardii PR-910]|nr:alpha/beta-hydrolase [Marasmius fiardii PR-910]
MSRSILLKTFHSAYLLAQPRRHITFRNVRRDYATAFDVSSIETVPLRFDRTLGMVKGSGRSGELVESELSCSNSSPIVFLHGLLGSKRNWTSISKAFAHSTGRPVYSIDLRNHGDSPHARPHTYEAMTADLFRFFEEHQLKDVTLIGHSMGGKVAMSMTLHPELPKGTLSGLVVEDIAPSRGPLSSDFRSYVEAMRAIEESHVKTRKEAMEILLKTEKDKEVVNFLLTNLITPKSGSEDSVKFRVPLNILLDHMDDLGSFPYNPGEVRWLGPTLFIKGRTSNYLNKKNIPCATEFFPNKNTVTLDANHWVHAQRPLEFRDAILNYSKFGGKE